MRKQEIFILFATFVCWIMTIGGRPFVGLIYFQLYSALTLSNIFLKFRSLRIPFTSAIIVLCSLMIYKSKRIYLSSQFKLMLALFGIMCLSRYVNNLEIMNHEYMDFFLKYIFAHILITNIVDDKRKLTIFLWILIISSTSLAFVARYYDSSTAYYYLNRNDFAAILVSVIPIALCIGLHAAKPLLKLEAFCYSLITVYAVLASNSRSAYLALLFVFPLTLVASKFKVRTVVFLCLLAMIPLSRLSDIHWDRIHSIRFSFEQGGTAGQRIAAWKTAAMMIQDRPIIGIGAGEFPDKFAEYATLEANEAVGGDIGEEKINTHNIVLQVWSENGLVGISIFLAILALSFGDLIKALRLCRGDPNLSDLAAPIKGLLIGFAGFLVAAQFSNTGYSLQLYTFVSLAVAARLVAEKGLQEAVTDTSARLSSITDLIRGREYVLRIILFGLCTYIGLQH